MELHKKARQLFHPAVHIGLLSGKWITKPIKKRLSKRGLKHRVLDVIGIIFVSIILIFGIWHFVFNADPGRKVIFSAVVAPVNITSGGDSTLSISYKNNSKKTLHNVTLTLEYPPYFVLKDIDHESFEKTTNTIQIDSLAPGANGLIKIRGVMFGNVGGSQTFSSTLGYSWNNDRTGVRRQTYTFLPSRSALAITTDLPDMLVSGQRLNGQITLTNNGSLEFPEASVHAIFPEGFILKSTSLAQRDDQTWIVPSIESGESLNILYSGTLAINTGDSARFYFEPSFVFGNEKFVQETLEETVTALPPPFTAKLAVPDNVVNRKAVNASIMWTNQSDVAISGVKVRINGATNTPEWSVDTPVIANEHAVSLIPKSSSGTNRTVTFTPIIEFTLDETGDKVEISGDSVERKLTTSIKLESFARYFTSAGDQLGRGPLPPRAGDGTIYWVFLNVGNTFNNVSGATVTARLPENVSWVDKQSVTKGSGVNYNPATRTITWNIGNVPATIRNARVAGASFAVSIKPSATQVGATPPLMTNIQFTGKDDWTGNAISKSTPPITTKIPQDSGKVR